MRRAGRVCPTIGCTNLIFGRDKYCPDCLHKIQKAIDEKRPNASQRGYDANWRKTRKEFLKAHPYCIDCGAKATEPDHIVPIKDGGTDDWSNLEPKCKKHHSSKTAKYDGGFGNPKG